MACRLTISGARYRIYDLQGLRSSDWKPRMSEARAPEIPGEAQESTTVYFILSTCLAILLPFIFALLFELAFSALEVFITTLFSSALLRFSSYQMILLLFNFDEPLHRRQLPLLRIRRAVHHFQISWQPYLIQYLWLRFGLLRWTPSVFWER